jgi:FKBP-type peptidyl-prolyl cis-trans isomerase SlyD
MPDPVVSRHKVVSFTYSIVDDAGNVLEQSDLPISYVHGGKSELFEKIEDALDGHRKGDVVNVTLTPKEGFGEHNPALTYTDDLANVPPELCRIGAEVQMQNDSGDVRTFVVTRIRGDKLTVDGNHPMAGKTVTFNIRIVDIREASAEEMSHGVAPMPVLH